MKRNAIEELKRWKISEERKPMVLKGTRQVRNTWLMKEFGQSYYEHCVYFNFDEEDALKSIFETNKNPERLMEILSMIAGEKMIDFVLQYGTEIIPVEVKGGEDRSAPIFKRYTADHQPQYALRYSKRGYRKDGQITNLPLYLARKTRELL